MNYHLVCIYQRWYRVRILAYNSCVDVHLQYSYRNQVVFPSDEPCCPFVTVCKLCILPRGDIVTLENFCQSVESGRGMMRGKEEEKGEEEDRDEFPLLWWIWTCFCFFTINIGFSLCKLPVQVFGSLFGGGCLSFSYWYLLVVENIFYFVANLFTFFMVFLRNRII